jgi:uncharacterized protein (DUF1501 family)
MIDRRTLLASLAGGGLAVLAPRLAGAASGPRWDRTLVLVELQGGNDGLNTVVPYTDETYRRLRPTLAVPADAVIRLDERRGLAPQLEKLMPSWASGDFAIVEGVGYPKPNRSHFRSIEIWDTASEADEHLAHGWLARLFRRKAPPAPHGTDSVVMGRAHFGPLGGAGPGGRTLFLDQLDGFVKSAAALPEVGAAAPNPALSLVLSAQRLSRSAGSNLSTLLDQAKIPLPQGFPQTPIGRQLAEASRLMALDCGVVAIKVSHGGFDTHAGQASVHQRLLTELADALMVFRKEMKLLGAWNRVLVATYSEFGRRTQENASAGTDHGAAAPQFLMGGQVKGGLYGAPPDLAKLVDGDPTHAVDFRSLYETFTRTWWSLGPDAAGLGRFAPLDVLRG